MRIPGLPELLAVVVDLLVVAQLRQLLLLQAHRLRWSGSVFRIRIQDPSGSVIFPGSVKK